MKVAEYLAWLRDRPLVDPGEILKGRGLLVMAPHPDDESLGCGGLIAWAVAHGHPVSIVFLTSGEGSHQGSTMFPPTSVARLRQQEAIRAAGELGVPPERLHFLGLPDGLMVHMDEAALQRVHFSLLGVIAMNAPVLMCVTSRTDPHGDHKAAWLIAQRVARSCQVEVLSFPVWTWALAPEREIASPARCAWRLATHHVERKLAAIAAHRSQLGQVIHDADTAFELPDDLLHTLCEQHEVLIDERL